MAKAKKKEVVSLEEKLEQALVPVNEQPYEVPENWCWVRFDSLSKDMADGPFGSNLKTEHYTENKEVRIIQLSNIGEEGWREENTKYTTFEHVKTIARSIVEPGNIVIAKMMPAGRAIICPSSEKMYVLSSDAVKMVPHSKLDVKYLVYCINSQMFRNQVQENMQGITRARTSIKKLKQYVFPLPPLAEQQRIVKQIESLFVKLDEAQCKLESALEESEIRRTAILNEAFKGELTKGWREKHKSCKNTVIEAVKLYSNTLSNKDKKFIAEGQAELNPIEMSGDIVWYETKIGAISRVTNGSTPSRQCEQYWNGDIPWVSSGEVRNNIIDVTEERITQAGYDSSSVKLLPKGTVLIAMIGEGKTRGQSAVLNIEATTNQNIAAIVIEHGQINSKFLWYWLQKEYKKNREKGAGSGPQALNCQRVRELDMIVPPIEEQDAIVEIIDELMQKEMQVIETISEVIDKISLIKKSIFAKAFRGELGTNNLDEESAVGLLKTILEQEE